MGVILSGILIDIQIDKTTHAEVQEVKQVIQPRKEVKLEVVYNWDKARIEREVLAVFHDAPIMLRVMKCEGGYDTNAYNPTNGSGDKGLFQVSTKYHGHRVKALGLDMNNPKDNIKYARMLYDANGLNDWSASKHCWSK